ncbi:MAG: transposase [Salinivirgaceae bacterium]|jgi:putative transposase|nr:transposase [Salinivirgaceae bacterium]
MNYRAVSIFHIVFYTHQLEPVLTGSGEKLFYAFLDTHLKKKNCQVYGINGTADHVHMLVEVSPLIPLSALLKNIDESSTEFIEESRIFSDFEGWKNEALAFSTSFKDREKMIAFIDEQKTYHKNHSTQSEFDLILKSHDVAQ